MKPKCKLHKTFPSIRPKGCKVKARQGATSANSFASHSSRSSSHSNGSGPGLGYSRRSTLTHVSDYVSHSSQATRSSRGNRGSQARSECIIERRLNNERLHRNSDNLINYYASSKRKKKSTSGASYPQSSQHSRAP
jgi:hypothetical protein